MASLRELFNIEGLESQEAKRIAVESQARELQDFIKGLRKRKAQVYTEILKIQVVTFDSVIALTSLLLQANLYCRRTHSMLLLRQIFASELAEALRRFYNLDYAPLVDYINFMKELFTVI